MTTKNLLATLCALCFHTLIFSQGEANNWYFGDGAGLRFNADGTVTATDDGQLFTDEGCATISDANGDLLFYTDGITVYTRNHQVMANGNGLFGDPSSAQSGIIVPVPNSDFLYYIFTVDTVFGDGDPDTGFNYSIVDMSLDGGNGAVTTKNVNLLPDSSEKLSAVVKNCFQNSIWVITQGPASIGSPNLNTFYSYEVNDLGINPVPVRSTISSLQIEDDRGYLKLSPDGTKLASANVESGMYLFDFDINTGIVSNPIELTISGTSSFPYGVEFSPNNRFLYVHSYNNAGFNGPHESALVQFDLAATDIEASQVFIDQRQNSYRGALQLGSNGKIYRTLSFSYLNGSQFLGVIESPNELGFASNYSHNAINLSPNVSRQGLPPFIQSLFNTVDIIADGDPENDGTTVLQLCEGETYTLSAPEVIFGASYDWTVDGVPVIPTGNPYELEVSSSGTYRVEINPNNGDCPTIGLATVSVNPLPEAFDYTLVQCDVDPANSMDGITTFNFNQALNDLTGGATDVTVTFYESAADLSSDTPITNTTAYRNTVTSTIIVKIESGPGCEDFATLTLSVQPTLASLPNTGPFAACDDDRDDGVLLATFDLDAIRTTFFSGFESVFFYDSLDKAYSEEDALPNTFVTEDVTIFVRVENSNECQNIETIQLIVDPKPEVLIENGIICLNDPLEIAIAEPGFDFYAWYKINDDGTLTTISSEQTANIVEPGTYRLEIGVEYSSFSTQMLCTNAKDFEMVPSNIATFMSFDIGDLRDNNTVTILVDGEGDYEYSIYSGLGPFQDSNVFENVPSGFVDFFVRDKNGCGTVGEFTAAVIGHPKFFTPNNDSHNDYWQLKGLEQPLQSVAQIYIFNQFGKLVKQLSPLGKGWDGTFNGQPLPASDYWFKAILQDGREFKGHFTLKR
ncbi:T9SS type B sorting domain-containing protein [Sungkyunkwania multivorans]|uniref:T9SS type B sorting domain-containing protein n=1 Tax=Sungkyunkwania multivorans TaxID=1173618 RepID=A0ABW3CU36_9FLAO